MKKGTKTEPGFITGSELARRLGVSETAVRKAVDVGRIIPALVDANGRRWFIEETARAQWTRNTLPEKETGTTRVVGDHAFDDGKLNITKAKALREASQAEMNVLKMKRMKKELVDADEVARSWEKHIVDVKQLFLAFPVKLKMHFPSLTNEDLTLIKGWIVDILETLAKGCLDTRNE